MSIQQQEEQIRQQDEQAEQDYQRNRWGGDDQWQLIKHLNKLKKLKARWKSHPVNDNINDAIEQVNEIIFEREFPIYNNGVTLAEYNESWNRSYEKWDKMDFNEKIKRNLV